jgi:hypothetical protein
MLSFRPPSVTELDNVLGRVRIRIRIRVRVRIKVRVRVRGYNWCEDEGYEITIEARVRQTIQIR